MKKSPENTEESPIGSNQRFFRFWKELRKERKEQNKDGINNWCNQGHIKSFRKNNVNHIPKVYLVEFFCSTYFRTITRKSPWHIRTLQGFSSWRKIRDLHTADSEGGAE